MKFLIFFLSSFSMGMLSLMATSAGLASDHCPICKKRSFYVELHSFSMFGEPSRDFLDSPIFSFGGPRICPWDLFASQSTDWEVEDQAEFVRIRTRLETKEPVILLTAEEGEFEEEIRKAGDRYPFLLLRELWWVRSLRSPMGLEEEIMMAMKLFDSCYGDLSPVPELREVCRLKLLALFKKAVADQSLAEESRFRYQYLHAEFVRKGGALEEALKEFSVFDKLLGKLPEEKRMKHEPLVSWTRDQILGLQFKTLDLESLVKELKLPLPNPFRDEDEEGASQEDWLRHRWGLEELVRRCVDGDQEASQKLWQVLGRDSGKLLAAVETISFPPLDRLGKAGPLWEKWRAELAGQLKAGKVPEGLKVNVNQERNVNLLLRIVRGGKPDYLIDAEGEADTPKGRLRAALTLMEKGTKGEAANSVVNALDELRALDWKLAGEEEMFDYPLQYLSKAFALSEDRFQAELEASLTKTWKDSFFREMVRLWLGKPNALAKLEQTEALKSETKYPGYGPAQMVYFHLEARKDPAWKERCVRDLENLEMLNRRVFTYADAIMTPELAKALMKRHDRLMAYLEKKEFKEEDWDWRPGELHDIETIWKETQLAKLSIQIKK